METDRTNTTYYPTTLDENTTYYWKITARDDKGATRTSPVWQFTTKSSSSGSILIPDPGFEELIRKILKKPTGEITVEDMESITEISTYNFNNDILSIEGIEYCANLTSLSIWDKSLSDISPISGLPYLEDVGFACPLLVDISPLKNLPNLKTIVLYQVGNITNIEIIGDITQLDGLGLSDNDVVKDFSFIQNLTNLYTLLLENNKISDISFLSNLFNLSVLELGENELSNIDALSNLTGLTDLTIWHNNISDISALSNLTNIENLDLSENKIVNINPISKMNRLRTLGLDDNIIQDIKPLVDNQGINEGDIIELVNNPLNDISINQYIPDLKARGVIIYYP